MNDENLVKNTFAGEPEPLHLGKRIIYEGEGVYENH
jgi:hypothetical protein